MSYNYFNSMLGSTSSKDNGVYSMFGTTNNMLGEYSMIKSGVYKKLLNAYYNKQGIGNTGAADSEAEETEEKAKLVTAKTDSNTLMEAANNLNNAKLYVATGKDEEGNNVYDREKIKENVKSFVKAYNSFIDSSSDVDNEKVLRKSLSIVKETATSQKLLNEVGITIGEGNKLVLDEKKLDEAYATTLSTLFTGRNSYASDVTQKASETYKLAYSAAFNNTRACSYTYQGAYTSMGSVSGLMDKYL